MISLLACAVSLAFPTQMNNAGTGTIQIDNKPKMEVRVSSGSHEFQSIEIAVIVNSEWSQTLMVETPLKNGTFPTTALISENTGMMNFYNASIGVDAGTWDNNQKQFMLKKEGDKPGTGTVTITIKFVSEDNKYVKTLLNGSYGGTLRHQKEDGSIKEWKVNGDFKDIPFMIPKKYWHPLN